MAKRWLVAMAAMSQLGCCIARGAKVKTPRGERRIEALAVGDEVVVVDPLTHEQHVGRVTGIRSARRECSLINSLKLTSAHPLFDVVEKEWAPAGDWVLGLRTSFAGVDGAVRVESAERFVGVDEVFDVSVDHPLHTFVADGVVVHNKEPIRNFALGTSCDLDGRFVFAGERCDCPDPEEEGIVACSPRVREATCSCSSAFYSSWNSGGVDDAPNWIVVKPCRDTPALSVIVDDERNALRITSGGERCGLLTPRLPMGADFANGEAMLRVTSMTDGFARLGTTDEIALLGVASNAGELWLALGAEAGFAVSPPVLPGDWYRVMWLFDPSGKSARVWPRVFDLAGQLLFTEREFTVAGQPLNEWYANGGSFAFTPTTRQFRLGAVERSTESVIDVRAVAFGASTK